ncbi:MAG TPA: hypothetical protein VGC09_21440 [Rhodopila sp.]
MKRLIGNNSPHDQAGPIQRLSLPRHQARLTLAWCRLYATGSD